MIATRPPHDDSLVDQAAVAMGVKTWTDEFGWTHSDSQAIWKDDQVVKSFRPSSVFGVLNRYNYHYIPSGYVQGRHRFMLTGVTLANLLGLYGNFETDTDGNGVANGWSLVGYPAASASIIGSAANVVFGDHAQRIGSTAAASSQSLTRNLVNADSRDVLFIAGYFRSVSGDTGLVMKVTQADGTVVSTKTFVMGEEYQRLFFKTGSLSNKTGSYYAFHVGKDSVVHSWDCDGLCIYNLTKMGRLPEEMRKFVKRNRWEELDERQLNSLLPYCNSVCSFGYEFDGSDSAIEVLNLGQNLISNRFYEEAVDLGSGSDNLPYLGEFGLEFEHARRKAKNLFTSVGSFEHDSDGDGIADGWYLYGNVKADSSRIELSADPAQGTVAQHIRFENASDCLEGCVFWCSPKVSVVPGNGYFLSFYMKWTASDMSDDDYLFLTFFRADGSVLEERVIDRDIKNAGGTSYRQFSYKFEAPVDAAKVQFVYHPIIRQLEVVEFYMDMVSFVDITSLGEVPDFMAEYFTAGSFDEFDTTSLQEIIPYFENVDILNWYLVRSKIYTYLGDGKPRFAGVVGSGFFSPRTLRVRVENALGQDIYEKDSEFLLIPVLPNREYCFSYTREEVSGDGTGYGEFLVECREDGTVVKMSGSSYREGSGRFSFSFQASTETRFVYLRLGYNTVLHSCVVDYKDFLLEEGYMETYYRPALDVVYETENMALFGMEDSWDTVTSEGSCIQRVAKDAAVLIYANGSNYSGALSSPLSADTRPITESNPRSPIILVCNGNGEVFFGSSTASGGERKQVVSNAVGDDSDPVEYTVIYIRNTPVVSEAYGDIITDTFYIHCDGNYLYTRNRAPVFFEYRFYEYYQI